jgi:hypothetical protein
MKWCCLGFQSHYRAAGRSGQAILIGRDSSGAAEIVMQYRAVDVGNEGRLHSDIPVATVLDIRIVFCPWCGRNAEEWYGQHVDSLYREGLKIRD